MKATIKKWYTPTLSFRLEVWSRHFLLILDVWKFRLHIGI